MSFISRRQFLRSSFVLITSLSVLLLGSCATGPKAPQRITKKHKGLAIFQGPTNATATRISVLGRKAGSLSGLAFSYQAGNAEQLAPKNVISNVSNHSDVVIHHIYIDGLTPNQTYTLHVRDAAGKPLDQRSFSALDLKPRAARIAAGSCMSDYFLEKSADIWKSVIDAKPDLMLLLGDNSYADVVDGKYVGPAGESVLWGRYAETFEALEYFRARHLIPTLAIWDDHDFGVQDGGVDHPYKDEAKRVFLSYFPQSPASTTGADIPELQAGPGTSSRFDAFGYRFLLLDNRYFRTAKDAKPESHFGSEQEKWIIRNLKQTHNPAWLIAGDQWFGAYHRFESYEGTHPASFKRFMGELKKTGRTMLFMSGDRHLSEVMKIEKDILGYETYEFTSSAIHARMYPSFWERHPNKRHVMGVDLKQNFKIFDLSAARNPLKIEGAAIGNSSKVLYRFSFDIQGSQPATAK
ncbi:MAG: alkaline phosphatase D family protein [Bdellovibrionales bacterium]|jgi:hypothetical protein|nr:alkaline phosphatase D family protein [Bdellovibrionales bacterium]